MKHLHVHMAVGNSTTVSDFMHPLWSGKPMTARLLVLGVLTGVGVTAGWWYPSQQYATGGWR